MQYTIFSFAERRVCRCGRSCEAFPVSSEEGLMLSWCNSIDRIGTTKGAIQACYTRRTTHEMSLGQ